MCAIVATFIATLLSAKYNVVRCGFNACINVWRNRHGYTTTATKTNDVLTIIISFSVNQSLIVNDGDEVDDDDGQDQFEYKT